MSYCHYESFSKTFFRYSDVLTYDTATYDTFGDKTKTLNLWNSLTYDTIFEKSEISTYETWKIKKIYFKDIRTGLEIHAMLSMPLSINGTWQPCAMLVFEN